MYVSEKPSQCVQSHSSNFRIVYDRETGRPRGFAFVEFADEAGAQRAVSELNGADFNGRQLRVNLANNK